MSESSSGVPAGMYPDPENPAQLRYWDGNSWGSPGSVAPTPPPPSQTQQPEPNIQQSNTPAGWYADPENPTQRRYWDGIQWTSSVEQPAPTALPPVVATPPQVAVVTQRRSNSLAPWALVLSIFIGLPGLILGFIALKQINTAGLGPDGRDIESGRGLAKAAIIVPIVVVSLAVLIVGVVFALGTVVKSSFNNTSTCISSGVDC
ncbi:MAG: DUF2510 domain-containing protein [Actinomycetes bacterium]